jgi:hypothetical protein
MKTIMFFCFSTLVLFYSNAQERTVNLDFQSSSFVNNPKIPFDEPFFIYGALGDDIEFVKVNVYYADKDFVLHSFDWNRIESNVSESFEIFVPAVLKSNTKYDFEVTTYKVISENEQDDLLESVQERLRFLLMNNIYFDGKNMIVNKPKDVHVKIEQLLEESLQQYESKNGIPVQAPSSLVLEELKKQTTFKFSRFFKRTNREERDSIATTRISDYVNHLVQLISSEVAP